VAESRFCEPDFATIPSGARHQAQLRAANLYSIDPHDCIMVPILTRVKRLARHSATVEALRQFWMPIRFKRGE